MGPYVEKLICIETQGAGFPHTEPFLYRKRAFFVENYVESVGNFLKSHAAMHKKTGRPTMRPPGARKPANPLEIRAGVFRRALALSSNLSILALFWHDGAYPSRTGKGGMLHGSFIT